LSNAQKNFDIDVAYIDIDIPIDARGSEIEAEGRCMWITIQIGLLMHTSKLA
jgi:hypothetical protein